jgi:hypothetical protein
MKTEQFWVQVTFSKSVQPIYSDVFMYNTFVEPMLLSLARSLVNYGRVIIPVKLIYPAPYATPDYIRIDTGGVIPVRVTLNGADKGHYTMVFETFCDTPAEVVKRID